MKHYLKFFSSVLIFSFLMGNVDAQTKTKIKTKTAASPKFVEKSFGTPASVTDVTDVADSSKSYNSVKSLLDKHVTLTYGDNTFKGNEPIRRGDFIVALNSALDALKQVATENGIDSSFNVTNTSANANMSAASVAENTNSSSSVMSSGLTDVQESSVYYPAVQGLMAKGVSDPFTDSKKLNAGAPMTESEVYDALNKLFGYDKSGMNPYAKTMSRDKFAMVLNNAVSNKLMEEYAMVDKNNAEAEQMRQQQKEKLAQEMASQDQMRKDSMNNAYKADQMEIEKKAIEAQSKKKHKK
ncbi:MAG: S-layer homology domain-containing protein [Bacteroidota bacterium]|nr:S-layer homology domain-containing protein [Bacteroidota bacterium]